MSKIFLSLLFAAILLQGCGESKEDMLSRERLSSVIRESNSLFSDFEDNKSEEFQPVYVDGQFDNRYTSRYPSKFRDLRFNLAAISISARFSKVRETLDSILSQSALFFKLRSDTYGKVSYLASIQMDAMKAQDYPIEDYAQYLHGVIPDFQATHDDLRLLKVEYDRSFNHLQLLAHTLNRLAKQFRFRDTLVLGEDFSGSDGSFSADWWNAILVSALPGDTTPPDSEDVGVDPVAKFLDSRPRIVKQVVPRYPEEAVVSKIHGTVWVKVWIDKKGKPYDAKVVKTNAALCNESALDAAMATEFIPAMTTKGPVAVWVLIPYTFKLKQ